MSVDQCAYLILSCVHKYILSFKKTGQQLTQKLLERIHPKESTFHLVGWLFDPACFLASTDLAPQGWVRVCWGDDETSFSCKWKIASGNKCLILWLLCSFLAASWWALGGAPKKVILVALSHKCWEHMQIVFTHIKTIPAFIFHFPLETFSSSGSFPRGKLSKWTAVTQN